MRSTLGALAFTVLVLATAAPVVSTAAGADDARSQVIALVHKVVNAFNKGDMATVKSLMAPGDQSIMDEMPPFTWRGPGATDAFLGDVERDAERMKDTESSSVVGPPTFIRIEGNHAYAVFPDHFRYKRAGVPVSEEATMAITALKSPAGWQIVAFAYSAGAH